MNNRQRLQFTLGLTLLSGCGLSPESPERTSREYYDRHASLETPRAVENAVNNAQLAEHAIIFVQVNWNPMLVWKAETFVTFANAHQSSYLRPSISFHYIDCTAVTDDYAPLRKLDGWRELEQANGGGSLIHGEGELVWLDHGHVVAVEPIQLDDQPGDLIAKAVGRWRCQ